MTERAYVGVSGVVNQEQQAQIEQLFKDTGLDKKRIFQGGVKATHKPQILDIENKYGREWYPVGDEISEAMRFGHNVMGVAQVCFDEEWVNDDQYREDFLDRALGRAAYQWLTGVQYDMLPDWCANPHLTERALDDVLFLSMQSKKMLTTTIQCQRAIMANHSPEEIANVLAGMPLLDYVLFDASGGQGVRMNPDVLLPYIEAVQAHPGLERLGIGVGGGLNAEVVRMELTKILQYFPDISWDAEGQLHPVNAEGKRPLDMNIVREYLEASAEVLC